MGKWKDLLHRSAEDQYLDPPRSIEYDVDINLHVSRSMRSKNILVICRRTEYIFYVELIHIYVVPFAASLKPSIPLGSISNAFI